MSILELNLERQIITEGYTLGRLYVANLHFGFTCEDTDRHLEAFPTEKVYGKSAIPRGRYRLTTKYSPHFGRLVPHLVGVPGYSDDVHIHGGNTAADSLGCPLLGRVRTANGVANCAERVQALTKLINDTEANGNQVFITVK